MALSRLTPIGVRTIAVLLPVAVLTAASSRVLIHTDRGRDGSNTTTAANHGPATLTGANLAPTSWTIPDPGPTTWITANLWVDADGGTCTRRPSAGAYLDEQACATMQDAQAAAAAGDRVVVKCGGYPMQEIAGSEETSPVKYYGESYDQPVSAATVVSAISCTTLAGLEIHIDKVHVTGIQAKDGNTYLDPGDPIELGIFESTNPFTDVVIDGWHGHQAFIAAENVTVKYSAFGNSNYCTAHYAAGTDEDALRFWPDTGHGSDNDRLLSSVIHDFNGGGNGQCGKSNGHNDAFESGGGDNMVFSGNLFYDNPTSNIQFSEFAGAAMGKILIQNNFFGATECCNNLSIGQGGCAGVTIRNNVLDVPNNNTGCVGRMTQSNNIFTSTGLLVCSGSGAPAFLGSGNVFLQRSSGCGTNPRHCTPSWVNGTPNGRESWTPELNRSDTCAKNRVSSGYPPRDFYGTSRPQSPKGDAGPYEVVGRKR